MECLFIDVGGPSSSRVSLMPPYLNEKACSLLSPFHPIESESGSDVETCIPNGPIECVGQLESIQYDQA